MAAFLAIMTETMPAGLLPQIGIGLGVSEALASQLVTLYALGSVLAAIPVTTVTRSWNRRPLFLMAICGVLVFNSITALSSHYGLTMTSAVSTVPGQTQLTRIWSLAKLTAVALVKVMTPPFAGEYASLFAAGRMPLADAVLTIDPPPRARKGGIAAVENRRMLFRLTARTALVMDEIITIRHS